MIRPYSSPNLATLLTGFLALTLWTPARQAVAQDRLPKMPGYERFTKIRSATFGSVSYAYLNPTWLEGGKAFAYLQDGKAYHYDIATRKTTPLDKMPEAAPAIPPRRRRQAPGGVARGRQLAAMVSPDEKWKAFFKDSNLWLSDADDNNPVSITTDGNKEKRIKYGQASWVYGEELYQNTAFWWSPDSRKVAYYRFDESKVPDYFLTVGEAQIQNRLYVEAYPKAGVPNPIVELYLYDVATKRSIPVDVRDGKPFENKTVGHYVYNIQWSPDGKLLLFNRTNRLQNIMEICACDLETGKCRVVVREESPDSWTENRPEMRWLKDGQQFILTSERNGWKNFYLHDLSGKFLHPITQHTTFEVASILRVDEEKGLLYYMARSGDSPQKLQLHRVRMDGTVDTRLTDPKFHHDTLLSPDGKHFIDTVQTHDTPPEVHLMTAKGEVLATLGKSDMSKFNTLGLKTVERFTFKAADGKTDLYGILHKPSDFDPAKKYPLLVQVYSGPESGLLRETFVLPNPMTELGFLVAEFDSRGTQGRGKKFKDEMYRKMGTVEIDDQAEGVKFLRQRPYVDGSRVGIEGTSYGGYASIMCLLRHPEVFQTASASSSVTDWRNYDTIYTERYMGLPEENTAGYAAGSAMTYARDLKGRLMLYYGTADDNVHPANTYQLIAALQNAGKSFEVQVRPDAGHSGLGQARMLEFFLENWRTATP